MQNQPFGEQWEKLNPVLVRGMQRSGTSILYRVLRACKIVGFPEGHLWDEVAEALSRLRAPTYKPAKVLKREGFALGEGRDSDFEKYIALAIDEFHRAALEADGGDLRWFDKSPGMYPVETLPMVVQLFPRSQILFIYRNGISTLDSGLKMWREKNPGIFGQMCSGWSGTMSVWRQVRGLLVGRYLELSQERIASDPKGAAKEITDFLGVPEYREDVETTISGRRENSAFPDRALLSYRHGVQWSEKEKEHFLKTCKEEMDAWGFGIDFDDPRGPELKMTIQTESPILDHAQYHDWLHKRILERRIHTVGSLRTRCD